MIKLVESARAGDRRAQRALFDRFHPRMMAYCMRCANGDRERAMDWTQEIFSRMFTGLTKLRDPARFSPWLFTIAANVCRTQGARHKRQREAHGFFVLEMENRPQAEDKQAMERRIGAVKQVLENIEDAKSKKIFMLKYTEPEHTTRQIAESLGIPHGTVTVTLSRVRAKLKNQLALVLCEEAG